MQDNRQPKADILLVDDTPENLRLLATALTQHGYKVRSVINGRMALMGAKAAPPDLILLDICMPGMSGYEVCQKLKSDPLTQRVPVVFISALDEVLDKVKAFSVGGVDFITKPFHFEEVIARIENQLTIQLLQRSLTELNNQLEERVQQRTAELQAEIKERKKAQEQLLHIALHDPLTQLPNRSLMMERLESAIAQAQTQANANFAVLFLDCDRFKRVNDSLGHRIGDRLLVAVAKRLKQCLRKSDTLARMGGDEFAVLVQDVTHPQQVLDLAQEMNHRLALPFHVEQYEIFINASIGVVFNREDLYTQLNAVPTDPDTAVFCYQDAEHLLRDADTAMYQAKAEGKGRYEVFNVQMHEQAIHLLQLENDLRRALDNQEFGLHYQPIVCLSTDKIVGFEALVRWNHPRQGLISPGVFIPAAEETGLILPLGEWILQTACQQLKQWNEAQVSEQPLSMSINFSVRQFTQTNILANIEQVLHQTQIQPQCLKLELTESVLIDQPESIMKLLAELKDMQLQLSLDDFGTGYSSLSYLHRFPMDILKIDKSFVGHLDAAPKNRKIIQTIVTLAHTLGMEAIAEGVETAAQLDCLRQLGCEYGQGFYFSPPVAAPAVESLLSHQGQW
ncbi:MAG: EAL domain-containing protein [Cyanobacteria bacterium P01_G01_bin.54]